jgi:fructose 1,6-bisphosphatase
MQSLFSKMETSKNRAFSVSEYKMFVYDCETPGYVTKFDYIDGLYFRTFKIVKNRVEQQLPNEKAYKEPVSINEKKNSRHKKVGEIHTLKSNQFLSMYIYIYIYIYICG